MFYAAFPAEKNDGVVIVGKGLDDVAEGLVVDLESVLFGRGLGDIVFFVFFGGAEFLEIFIVFDPDEELVEIVKSLPLVDEVLYNFLLVLLGTVAIVVLFWNMDEELVAALADGDAVDLLERYFPLDGLLFQIVYMVGSE